MMDKSFFMATSNCCWISAHCGECYSWLVLLSTVRYLLIFPHSSLKPIVSFPHNELMCWTSDLKTWTVWVQLTLRTSWFHLGSAYHPQCVASIFWVHYILHIICVHKLNNYWMRFCDILNNQVQGRGYHYLWPWVSLTWLLYK